MIKECCGTTKTQVEENSKWETKFWIWPFLSQINYSKLNRTPYYRKNSETIYFVSLFLLEEICHVNLFKPYVQREQVANAVVSENYESQAREKDLDIPYINSEADEFDF